mmetsp:Transcript_9650/g.15576  ORF Transcript_9650/g.15576 Transcript_9650/m.15576 type:complete len:218 (+) Transcript_9650:2-655(+)
MLPRFALKPIRPLLIREKIIQATKYLIRKQKTQHDLDVNQALLGIYYWLSTYSEEPAAVIAQDSSMLKLIAALGEYGESFQKHNAQILQKLCSYNKLRMDLYENGVIDILLTLRDSPDPDARKLSLDAVFDLVKSDKVIAAIPADSDLMQMMTALSRFGSAQVKGAATKIVNKLSKFQEMRIKKERAAAEKKRREEQKQQNRKNGRGSPLGSPKGKR